MKWLVLLCLLFSCRSTQNESRPVNVSTAKVDQRDVPIYFDAIGQALSPVTVQVTPQVGGKLLEVYVQQGSDVQNGDPLYKIDPRPFQAALEEAQAQLAHDQALYEYAQRTVERYKKVVEEDFIAILTFEQYVSTAEAARAQVELDKAAIELALLNLEFCTVVAPVTGKISFFASRCGKCGGGQQSPNHGHSSL